MDASLFIEKILQFGLEYFKIYPGVYRGIVVRNDDPEGRGRVQAYVPQVGQNAAPDVWIKPSFAGSGQKRGQFWPPELDDTVFVSFQQGNAGRPEFYIGGWFGNPDESDTPGEFAYSGESEEGNAVPEKRGFVTRGGHTFVFSDEQGNRYVRLIWHNPDPDDESISDPAKSADRSSGEFAFMDFGKDGSVNIGNKNGALISMDATGKTTIMLSEHGHSISMTEDGINLVDKDGNLIALDKGKCSVVVNGNVNVAGKTVNLNAGGVNLGSPATMSAVNGEILLAWALAHTHVCGAPGSPSGPAVPPLPPNVLSQSIKHKL